MMSGLKAMEMDRISDFPRPILQHILSSLSQIDAVKTCVLSKSWRLNQFISCRQIAREMMSGLKAMEMDRISDFPRPILQHILSSLSQIDAVKTCVLSKSWRLNQFISCRQIAREMMSGLKAMEMDRISDFPRPILHHILSYLSQIDAVKTCVLSKSWRYIWHGRPNVEFCKDDFKGLTVEEYISVLVETLIGYENQNLSIQKLILKMPETTIDSVSAPLLEKWIPITIMRNLNSIETFHLLVSSQDSFWESTTHWKEPKYFDLPSVIFLSESLRDIHLKGCKLNQINSTTDKVLSMHLQTLRLYRVHVEEQTFERIMSGCPLIKEVSLNKCEGLKTIKLNNHSCSLECFEFWSYCEQFYAGIEITNETINLTHLKSLHLSYLRLSTKSLDIVSCNFPCLEELELISYCSGDFEEFQLSSRSIKRLAIEVDDPIKVSIDAPNICMFEYEGNNFPSHISFTTTSNKWKSNLVLKDNCNKIDNTSPWLHKLDELLKALSRSETSLHIRVIRWEDDYRFYGPADDLIREVVKHLELCLGSLCSDYSICLEEEGREIEKWNS